MFIPMGIQNNLYAHGMYAHRMSPFTKLSVTQNSYGDNGTKQFSYSLENFSYLIFFMCFRRADLEEEGSLMKDF